MNVLKKILLSTSIMGISFASTTYANPVYDQLKSYVDAACPVVWEDLGVSISETVPSGGDVWQGDAADKSAWVAAYAASENLSVADAQVIAGVVAAVASECASYRTALIDELIANTPSDVTQALTSAGGEAGDFLNGAWLVGDVRVTGRGAAAPGWVFLAGQTIGSVTSGANLTGNDYKDLFLMARSWAPNSGNESWDSGATVRLPDMRGRALVGADNLGGASANVIGDAQADVIGGKYGGETRTLTAAQLPIHKHTMSSNGAHNHTMGNDTHSHKMRTSLWNGSSVTQTTWPYFKGRARLEYYNKIPSGTAVENDTHKHSLTSAPNHAHTINNTGSSASVTFTQPSITFNVEMKY